MSIHIIHSTRIESKSQSIIHREENLTTLICRQDTAIQYSKPKFSTVDGQAGSSLHARPS